MYKYFPKMVFFTLQTLLNLKLHMVWGNPYIQIFISDGVFITWSVFPSVTV
jgi:hypothetical protein